MNYKFENRYYSTDEILSEYVHKVLCRKLKVMGAIIAAAALIMLFISFLDNNYILSAVFGVCLFISVCVTVLSPSLMLKQLKESDRRIHNDKKFETVVQFGDNISISEGAFSLAIEFAQILKVYSLKHSYVLMFGKNNAIIINPDTFTLGTFEEFKSFIQSRCHLVK